MDAKGLSIAILISGHPRTWEFGCEWVNRFRERFKKADVFYYLWDRLDAENTWRSCNNPNAKIETPFTGISDSLHPELGAIDNIGKQEFHRTKLESLWRQSKTKPFHVLSQWYSVWRAWSLLEEYGNQYDLVVRHRLDIDARFDILPEYRKGIVVGCRNSGWANRVCKDVVCDCHAYGNMESMGKYCNAYVFAEELLLPHICGVVTNGKKNLHPELAISHHLSQMGVDVYCDPNYKRTIHRMDGTTKEL